MDFLFDTNIFLEVLLGQEKRDSCKKFAFFDGFMSDITNNGTIITLPIIKYPQISVISQKYQLDFDDSMQTAIAIEHNFGIITIDSDFIKVAKDLTIRFV